MIVEEGKRWWVEKATDCVWAKGSEEEEMEERVRPSTLAVAAAGAAEVANASNCGHFIMISRACESPPPLEEE